MPLATSLLRSWQLLGAPSRNPGVCSGLRAAATWPLPISADFFCGTKGFCTFWGAGKRLGLQELVFSCRAVQDFDAEYQNKALGWGAAPQLHFGVDFGVLGHRRGQVLGGGGISSLGEGAGVAERNPWALKGLGNASNRAALFKNEKSLWCPKCCGVGSGGAGSLGWGSGVPGEGHRGAEGRGEWGWGCRGG